MERVLSLALTTTMLNTNVPEYEFGHRKHMARREIANEHFGLMDVRTKLHDTFVSSYDEPKIQ